ncbi:hypothetical protein GCM10027418_15530 [Mariniluteicoccus endophyticus]
MWRWEPDQGTIDTTFPSQAEAEAWLTEAYEDLADQGVTEVTLHEGDRVVYGPMSLLPS